MHDSGLPPGFKLVWVAIIVSAIVVVVTLAGTILGFGGPIDDASHTGYVTDVSQDTGLVFETTQVTIKTHPTADDGETFCVRDEDESALLSHLRAAHAGGDRVTVAYSRPLFVGFYDCQLGAPPIDGVGVVGS